MIRCVLAALDASERAPAVFAAAADLAEASRARLHLLRVVEIPAEHPPAAHVSHPDRLAEIAHEGGEHALLELADGRTHLVAGYAVVQAVEPWRAILSTARDLSADVIVIGSHGRHGFERLLGTTASRIIGHADRDLFIVHSQPKG